MCSILHVEMGNQVAYVMQGVFVSRCECEYLISLLNAAAAKKKMET